MPATTSSLDFEIDIPVFVDVVPATPSKKRRGPPPLPARAAVDEEAAPPPVRVRRWPVYLCALVAGMSGGMAFVTSPAGHTPAVQGAVAEARTFVAAAAVAVRATVAEITR